MAKYIGVLQIKQIKRARKNYNYPIVKPVGLPKEIVEKIGSKPVRVKIILPKIN